MRKERLSYSRCPTHGQPYVGNECPQCVMETKNKFRQIRSHDELTRHKLETGSDFEKQGLTLRREVPLVSGLSAGKLGRITLQELFPEIARISDKTAETCLEELKVPEKSLQDSLRVIFRRKGAALSKRSADSAKEVADIEQFVLRFDDVKATFAVVVKGFRSTSGKKLTWEHIAHQVTKARRANPDYVLVFSAKEPVDELITSIEEFNQDIGRPGCVIFVTPLDLCRLLIADGF